MPAGRDAGAIERGLQAFDDFMLLLGLEVLGVEFLPGAVAAKELRTVCREQEEIPEAIMV